MRNTAGSNADSQPLREQEAESRQTPHAKGDLDDFIFRESLEKSCSER